MKYIKGFFKTLLAGIVAFSILSAIFAFIYLVPVHIPNESGNTDYKWPADSVWIKLGENYTYGKFDSNGYNNTEYIENPDYILLGSSHVEGTNVLQSETIAYQLNNMLSGEKVYNMGISGHVFDKVCQYLPTNLEQYKCAKAVIIETHSLELTGEDVENIMTGNVAYTNSHNEGIMAMLQKIPFIRASYSNYENGLKDVLFPKKSTDAVIDTVIEQEIEYDAYDKLFTWIGNLSKEYGTEIIIFYHPLEKINADGTVTFSIGKYDDIFANGCAANGITFINMADKFSEMYETEKHVPHGFSTGELGKGHINKYGQKAIVEELYKTITAMKEEGRLCK